jgi:YEATS domain-containing protein 4
MCEVCANPLDRLVLELTGASIAIENVAPGEPFEVHETGWGEFEISIKLFYVPESLEKPQTMYHQLRLHPYGTDAEKEAMKQKGEIRSWGYEEMVFNEPYENFYELLTSPMDRSKGGKGKGTRIMKGGMVGSVGERTVTLPNSQRPDQPFSKETEMVEIQRLKKAHVKVEEQRKEMEREIREKEQELLRLREQAV